MKAKAGGDVHVAVAVMHAMKAPEDRDLVFEDVPGIRGEIEHQYSGGHAGDRMHRGPLEKAEGILFAPRRRKSIRRSESARRAHVERIQEQVRASVPPPLRGARVMRLPCF